MHNDLTFHPAAISFDFIYESERVNKTFGHSILFLSYFEKIAHMSVV